MLHRMAKRKSQPICVEPRRSRCPLTSVLDLVGDRWTLVVVRDLSLGKSTFDELQNGPEQIATNVLADRLRQLCELRLVERQDDTNDKRRKRYRLTEKGQRLKPLINGIIAWGLRELADTTTDPDRLRLK
jgi:DNA-binding HxlR family transcriptional regulator